MRVSILNAEDITLYLQDLHDMDLPACDAPGPAGLGCTRSKGHEPEDVHVAHVEGAPVAVWVDVKRLPDGCYTLYP